jgi:hypothetical protein
MGEEQGLSAENRALVERLIGSRIFDDGFQQKGARFYPEVLNRLLDAARAEGLQPPVGVDEEVFSSLGASKAPSCGSPTDCQTSGG